MGDPGSASSIKRIAVIGAGPVGVSCAKYLLAENVFDTIDIYEQRDGVGGIWNLSVPERSRHIPVPQTDPRYGQKVQDDSSLEFESPLYDYLETNIPKQLMAFSDVPFPEDDPLFPSHQAVLRYLEKYAQDVKHLIRFSTAVTDIRLVVDQATGQERWNVVAQGLTRKKTTSAFYDAVVVANGHYTVPYVPDIKGIAKWNATYPEVIIHSKAYRRPEDFKDKKVLVIGNSASGLDIATQIAKYCKGPVLLSARSVSAFGTLPPAEWREDVDEVVDFLSQEEGNRAVRFRSGRIVKDLDSIVFATGYFYTFPFLSGLLPPIVTDGLRIRGLYQDLFHIEHPTLAFPVVNLKVIPFPLSQNEGALIARVWSGRLDIPPTLEMKQWELDKISQNGDGKHFHLKKFPQDAAQVNELYAWAEKARRREGLENDGQGKLGTRWDERQVWMRSQFPNIKAAYAKRGEAKLKVRTMEELGFDFDEWRKTAQQKDLDMFREAKC
ncbi:dimethylaniline monooxygenase (N-oxide forming) [Exophiala viscosa]|uniref:dimethylaniline monooxygenase (N-oxide forming) n=1 Tax=Exophiala viscosa TaxID=2486360 RepID=UPI00218FFF3E|nr:dimethylaniline monooxygenase (N-oxide forming) [Exophiala viscosa]